MKIIISPAKKMNDQEDYIAWETLPVYVDRANKLKDYLKGLSYADLQGIWKCNDEIASLNYERLQEMTLHEKLVPALLAYEGLQYQYMAPHVFDQSQWDYVKKHLVILSGFYGLLRPTDGVTPYRLEMQSKFNIPFEEAKNLYQYWNSMIYEALMENNHLILNLASKEYSKVIEKFLRPEDRIITCTFGVEVEINGEKRVKMKATEAKMARGEMVRYLATHQVEEPELIKAFSSLNYTFSEKYSSENHYVFLKNPITIDKLP